MPTRKRGTGGPAFTVPMPHDLTVRKGERDAWWLDLPERELRLSNLDKVFWPEEAITKGDVIAYYANVADLLLPHLEHRPLTMKRMPDGIDGDAFYEKTAPSHTPEWVHRCTVLSEDAKAGRIDYLTVDDLPTLLFVANLGAIEMHPLHSRCGDVEHPDYLFFDLDPFPPYTYEDVLAVARHIRVLLDGFGMTGHPKTSGATGLQIFVRLEPGSATYAEVRAFVGACGSLIKQADPDRVTMAWRVADRSGKIFIDHNMNRRGANIAAAYSLRPEPRAPVSTPLTWDEVEAGGFEPRDFRIDNVWERFASVGDLWDGVRTGPAADVAAALDALGVEVDEDEEPGRLPRTAASSVATKTLGRDRAGLEGPRAVRVRPPARVRPGGHHRARAGRRGRRRQLVRDPQAPRHPSALRRASREGRRSAVLGRAEGPAHPERRQAAGGADRGAPARVRDVRRHDPGGSLRRRRGPDLRRRLVRADRMDRHEGVVPPARPALSRHRVPLREDADRLAGVPRVESDRADDRLAPAVPADARRGRLGSLRRSRLVVRAEVRRHPMPRRALDRADGAAHAHRPRRYGAVPRDPHDPRARRSGEHGDRRRDRGVRRGRQGTLSRSSSSG